MRRRGRCVRYLVLGLVCAGMSCAPEDLVLVDEGRPRSVIVIPGEAFGERGAGWLRLSFAASEARIREGLERIAAELRGG